MAHIAELLESFIDNIGSAAERKGGFAKDIFDFVDDLLLDVEFDEVEGQLASSLEFHLYRGIHDPTEFSQ
jgi:hypothetical protein